MKKFSILLLGVVILFGCTNNNQAKNEKGNKLNWQSNIDKAVTIAQKENKHVLVFFTGSNWCKWCVKLNKEVFNKKDFQKYAEDNLVLVSLDFPRPDNQDDSIKKYNIEKATQYRISGFPTVIILDKNGKKMLVSGYLPGGATSYINHIEKALM